MNLLTEVLTRFVGCLMLEESSAEWPEAGKPVVDWITLVYWLKLRC